MKKIIRITTVSTSLGLLLKGQLKFMSQYYDVLGISSSKGLKEVLEEQAVRGYAVNMTRRITPLHDFFSLLQLISIFYKEKPDIVHTHTPKAGIIGMLAAWIARVPVRLHTVAGLPLLVYSGPKRKLLECVEKLTYWCANRVYSNSFVMKDIITEIGLAPMEKIKVIGKGSSNGIDTSFFSPELLPNARIKIRSELKIDLNDFVFIFVGRIVEDKGVNELINAFIKILIKYDNIKLILVGSFERDLDPINPTTEDEIIKNQSIFHLGFQKDVRSYMLAADSLVFPSYREGFPNVVLQAGAMGLPAIVTNINGCNEIIEHGLNGVIIPSQNEKALYESMLYFIENKDGIIRKMAAKARPIIAGKFDQQVFWHALLNEYQSFNNV